jgi:hypothetical protein
MGAMRVAPCLVVSGLAGLVVLAALTACGAQATTTDAPPCGAGELACGGVCVDPQLDPAHCGDCGIACSPDQECRGGECGIPCRASLTAPVVDDWGLEWDGAERTAATAAEAAAACEAFSGRLPSVTELYRVRGGDHAIATAADTNPLWSATPAARDDQVTVALAGGAIAETVATTPLTYRCVCAAAAPAYFGGARCNGPPTSACYAVGDLNVDSQDRPPLRKGAAIWECANEHAHLATVPQLVAAVQQGVLGSGAALLVADQSRYDLSTTMRWTTATWPSAGNIATISTVEPAAFRCAGRRFAIEPNPNVIANQFTGRVYKGEQNDTAPAAWPDAHDTCTARGGHLPRSSELAELIVDGLPNGTNVAQWTSDQVGYNGEQFLTTTMTWTATDPRYPYDYADTSTMTWDYKTGSQAFRCIYYPLDVDYAAPTTCNGGCYEVALPGAIAARMWFDSTERPPALLETAIAACRAEAGELASERDLTEAVRAGLPNGTSPAWTLTSELAMSNVHVVRWTGAEPDVFTDQYSTYMTWAGLDEPYAFRCMWTNELR